MAHILSQRLSTCFALCLIATISFSTTLNSAEAKTPEPVTKSAERIWLGVTIGEIDTGNGSVVIEKVAPASSAAEMGVQAHDSILQLGNASELWTINNTADLKRTLNTLHVGDTIRLHVARNGSPHMLTGTLKAYPSETEKNLNLSKKTLDDGIQLINTLSATDSTTALALTMHNLSQSIEALPEKIEEAAREFKKIYPDGEFTFKIEINISSSKSSEKDDTEHTTEEKDADTLAEQETAEEDADISDTPTTEPETPDTHK